MDTLAITIRWDEPIARVITSVTVRQAESSCREGLSPRQIDVRAMWDTGSLATCVSTRIAHYLGLNHTESISLTSVHGTTLAKVYPLDIVLPDGIVIANIKAPEIGDRSDFDIIIGMNIIRLGDFALSNDNGKPVMSFRLPSGNVPVIFSKMG
jgi:hypothetical protein